LRVNGQRTSVPGHAENTTPPADYLLRQVSKSADELAELYGSKGVTDTDSIIAYCRIGERSAHTWFVLHELLGKDDVKNYDGSWTEWGNLVNVPVEKGA
jgi:3-mercaptopyruvate sulfurtransferase SseA